MKGQINRDKTSSGVSVCHLRSFLTCIFHYGWSVDLADLTLWVCLFICNRRIQKAEVLNFDEIHFIKYLMLRTFYVLRNFLPTPMLQRFFCFLLEALYLCFPSSWRSSSNVSSSKLVSADDDFSQVLFEKILYFNFILKIFSFYNILDDMQCCNIFGDIFYLLFLKDIPLFWFA